VFTGLIQAVGRIVSIFPSALALEVEWGAWDDALLVGESIAVNGCCLTVAGIDANSELRFDLSEETWSRTAFSGLAAGTLVNLERSLRPTDRMGGHFVQGHVDGIGTLVSRTPAKSGEVFRFRVPEEGAKYLAPKGSIALDGISLTIVEPHGAEFDVAVIPHTLAETNLRILQPGDKVNVEYDMLAKYVERLWDR